MTSEELVRRREQIKRDRDELGRSVQALADKVDVKSRARDAIGQAKATAKARVRNAAHGYGGRELIWGLASAAATVAVLAAVAAGVRRTRRSTH